jgi:hypothetical protein
MPRTKKPAGTAVDHRNGRRIELTAAVQLARFGLPRRVPAWSAATRRAWAALWDDPISSLLSAVDRPVLLRWADALERGTRALADADADPIGTGSMGQPVENPLYGIAQKALSVAKDCEAQLGVGALHRARLGIETTHAVKSLNELNAGYAPGAGGGDVDDDDPRAGGSVAGSVISG